MVTGKEEDMEWLDRISELPRGGQLVRPDGSMVRLDWRAEGTPIPAGFGVSNWMRIGACNPDPVLLIGPLGADVPSPPEGFRSIGPFVAPFSANRWGVCNSAGEPRCPRYLSSLLVGWDGR